MNQMTAAEALVALDRDEEAEAALMEALALSPGHPRAIELLQRLREGKQG